MVTRARAISICAVAILSCASTLLAHCGGSSDDSTSPNTDASSGDATTQDGASLSDGGSTDAAYSVPLPGKSHGIFVVLDQANAKSARVAATFLAAGAPAASVVKGATLQVHWNEIQPEAGAIHLDPNAWPLDAITAWRAAGKQVNLVFQSASYGPQIYAPTWYSGSNPMYGSPQCGPGSQPVQWSAEFVAAWQDVMSQVKAHFDDNSVGYIRFGLGLGGENSPTIGTSSMTCQQAMTALGFTDAGVTWPNPSTPAFESEVADYAWIPYESKMVQYQRGLGFSTELAFSLSPINYSVGAIDYATPDTTSAFGVDAGFMIGDQGWRQSDESAYPSAPCTSDWCKIFDENRGKVPLELQPVFASDVPGSGMDGSTGNLVPMLPFAMSRGAQVLELYLDDLLCAFDPSFSGDAVSNPPYPATHAQCEAAGYPAALQAAAAALN